MKRACLDFLCAAPDARLFPGASGGRLRQPLLDVAHVADVRYQPGNVYYKDKSKILDAKSKRVRGPPLTTVLFHPKTFVAGAQLLQPLALRPSWKKNQEI